MNKGIIKVKKNGYIKFRMPIGAGCIYSLEGYVFKKDWKNSSDLIRVYNSPPKNKKPQPLFSDLEAFEGREYKNKLEITH